MIARWSFRSQRACRFHPRAGVRGFRSGCRRGEARARVVDRLWHWVSCVSKRMQPIDPRRPMKPGTGSRPLDLDQDYCVGAAGSLAATCPLPEGALLRTLRQLLSGEDVIQLADPARVARFPDLLDVPSDPAICADTGLEYRTHCRVLSSLRSLSKLLGGRPGSRRQFSPSSISQLSSGRRPGLA